MSAKAQQALQMRKAGATYPQIAKRVGYASPSSARRAVVTALRADGPDTPEDAHNLEVQRLDQMLMVLWQNALQGSGVAIDRILKIIDTREALTRPGEARSGAGPVTVAVRKELEPLPEQLQRSALAASALELAGLIDRGVSPAACTKELRAVLADLTSRAASGTVATGGIADLTARIAERRRQAAGGAGTPS